MRLLALCVLVSSSAFAGERYLGTIVSAAVDKTNDTTSIPFYIPSDAKITVQCDVSSYIATDTTTAVTSSTGLLISASTIFPTSTGTQVKVNSGTAANGGAVIRILATAGTANCKVFERRGNE